MSMTLGDPKPAEAVVVVTDGPVKIVAELVPEPPTRHWSHWKTAFLIALPLLMALYVYIAARGMLSVAGYKPPEAIALIPPEPNGPVLYQQNCARCHGPAGQGGGLASEHLDPPARRFGEEKFMLGTTSTGIPSDDDLVYLMKHGIPGTAMPPFENLNDEQRRAIAQHIRRLAYAGLYGKLWKQAAKDEEPDPTEIHQRTAKQLTIGDALPLPPNLANPSPESLAHGKEIFLKNCAACHGPEGKGDGKDVSTLKTDSGRPTRPRNLASGIYKGGGEPDRLFARISLGMPGTPMPDLRILAPEQRADLVHFIRSLSRPEEPPAP
jgi:cytochrome c oxidase cbb3-type subunit I/II